jgi:replicative DNA helicase
MAGRVLPHNLDAEASVLGGVLLRNDVLTQIDTLEVDDFYSEKHKVVWKAVRELEATGKPIDIVTLENQIERGGRLEAIGGMAFLAELAMRVPTPENVVHYASIVADKAQARRLAIVTSEVSEKVYDLDIEVPEYMDWAEGKVFEVTQRKDKTGPEPIKSLIKKVFGSLDERFNSAGGITGVPTGFADLDAKTAGLQPTELIILAAPRPWARPRSRCPWPRTRPPCRAAAGRCWCSRSRCRRPSWPNACCAPRRASTRRRSAAASCSART